MDAEPAAKRPCLKQTTLFGQVVVTDVDIYKKPTNDYERFVNEFVRRERRARGSYTCTEQNRASYKRAADQAWRTASAAEKRKLIDREDETPSTSKASSSSQSKVNTLISHSHDIMCMSSHFRLGRGEGVFCHINFFRLAAMCELMRWPLMLQV